MAATFVFLAQENNLAILSLTEEELVVGATSFCGWLAGMVGNSLNTAVSTRVQTVVDLYRCLATPEPGFYENPMMLEAGDSSRYMEAGAVAGNAVIVTACFILHFFCDYFMKKPLFVPLPRLFARAAWVLYIALTQPTITFCIRLMDSGVGGNVAAGVIVMLYWLVLLVIACVAVWKVKVRWLPFGAGAATEDLVKLYPELAPLPPGADESAAAAMPTHSSPLTKDEKNKHLLGDQEMADASAPQLNAGETSRPSAAAAGNGNDDDDDGDAAASSSMHQRSSNPLDDKKSGSGDPAALKKSTSSTLASTAAIDDFVKHSSSFHVGYDDTVLDSKGKKHKHHHKRIAESKKDKVYVNRPLLPGERRAGKWVELYAESKDKLRFGALFMGLRPGFTWFLLMQITLSWVYGILQGVKSTHTDNKCEREAWAATIFLIFEAVIYAAVQPSRFFHDNLVFDFITAGNMAAGAMLASRRVSGYSEILVYVAVMVVAAMMILKALVDIYHRVRAKLNKDELLNQEADLQAQQGQLSKGDAARAILEKKKALDAKEQQQQREKQQQQQGSATNDGGAAPAAASSASGGAPAASASGPAPMDALGISAESDANDAMVFSSAPQDGPNTEGGSAVFEGTSSSSRRISRPVLNKGSSSSSSNSNNNAELKLQFGSASSQPVKGGRRFVQTEEEYSPMRHAMEEEEDIELKTSQAISRLGAFASSAFSPAGGATTAGTTTSSSDRRRLARSAGDDDDDDGGLLEAAPNSKRAAAFFASGGARKEISTVSDFLALSPNGSPAGSPARQQQQQNNNNNGTTPTAIVSSPGGGGGSSRPIRIGANGLVEGLTLLDTAPALPLRLSPGRGADTTQHYGQQHSAMDYHHQQAANAFSASPNSGAASPVGAPLERDDSHHLSQLRASRDEPVRNLNPLDEQRAAAARTQDSSPRLEDEFGLGDASPRTAAAQLQSRQQQQAITDVQLALDDTGAASGGNRGADVAARRTTGGALSSYSLSSSLRGAFAVPSLPLMSSIQESASGSNSNKNIFKRVEQPGESNNNGNGSSYHLDPETPTVPPPFSTGVQQQQPQKKHKHSFAPFAAVNGGKSSPRGGGGGGGGGDALGPLRANTAGSHFPSISSEEKKKAHLLMRTSTTASTSSSKGDNESQARPLFSGFFAPTDKDISPTPKKKQQQPTAHDVRPLLTQFSVAHLPQHRQQEQQDGSFAQHVTQEDQRQMSKMAPPLPVAADEDEFDLPPVQNTGKPRTFAPIDIL